ncbi:MAG: Gfo/Idh/MocA family oxidoreductase [Rhodoferax sp.]|nr:Gfo/Idh/MocA family oxidoreductase [Rhodoferax sp.]MDP3650041.1 Gfo/Idh/MocA family oxidoreductase [Rhodoferax sp.]
MRWAFIGASNIAGRWMVDAVRSVGDDVIAVVSGDPDRAKAFADAHHIGHALADESPLKGLGVDAVYISTTNEKHEASVLRAAACGFHVLCEKPLATRLESARRMVNACHVAGVTLGTNFHLRHNQVHQMMRDSVRNGALGQMVCVRVNHSVFLPHNLQGWRLKDKAAGGGVVLDIAVHNADSVAFILGEYPEEVTALTGNSGMGEGLEDTAMSIWRFPSGITVFTHQGFATPYGEKGIELLGTKAALKGISMLDQGSPGTVTLMSDQGNQLTEMPDVNLYNKVLENFHKALRGESTDMADGKAGLNSLAVALSILESAKSGQTVHVNYGHPQGQ